MTIHEEMKPYTLRGYTGRMDYQAKLIELAQSAHRTAMMEKRGAPFHKDFFGKSLTTLTSRHLVGEREYVVVHVAPILENPKELVLGVVRELTLPNAPYIFDMEDPRLLDTMAIEDVLAMREAVARAKGMAGAWSDFSMPSGKPDKRSRRRDK